MYIYITILYSFTRQKSVTILVTADDAKGFDSVSRNPTQVLIKCVIVSFFCLGLSER